MERDYSRRQNCWPVWSVLYSARGIWLKWWRYSCAYFVNDDLRTRDAILDYFSPIGFTGGRIDIYIVENVNRLGYHVTTILVDHVFNCILKKKSSPIHWVSPELPCDEISIHKSWFWSSTLIIFFMILKKDVFKILKMYLISSLGNTIPKTP